MAQELTGVHVHVVIVSDRSARGEREDATGPALAAIFEGSGADVHRRIVPDGVDSVRGAIRAAVESGARVVVTAGGTGLSPRDHTPEATAPLLSRAIPGVAERLRAVDAENVPASALSRGVAGVTDEGVLVINLAGSPGAARSGGAVLVSLLPHALSQLAGDDH